MARTRAKMVFCDGAATQRSLARGIRHSRIAKDRYWYPAEVYGAIVT